jgi:hypothetical protein
MKSLLFVVLCATTLVGGCAASRPLSDTEFRGFCYTSVTHRASCDTISICNEYDSNVLSVKHPSRQACGAACGVVYDRLFIPNQFDGCDSAVLMAYNWCKKYCNTNYPN